ncbi:MAG: TonB-dependent receptor [Candidatus Kapabacteria bacterium]|nr:TonB-dependent receptor [Candidatus Kapabacteria bacterium]
MIIWFGISLNLFAESIIEVVDEDTKAPVPYVKVTTKCIGANCTDTVNIQLTSKNGQVKTKFDFPFDIEVNHIGFQTYVARINSKADLQIILRRKEFVLDEIVTTGQYTPRSAQSSVYQVKTVTAERIVAQGAVNLRDLMTNEMNVRLSQDNILGSSMSINGVSGQNVKIMIDGVPVVGRLGGNIDLSQINLNNARRVEIIEGPMSAIYGTDALGGVINIITEDHIEDDIKITGNTLYESVGVYNIDGSLGYKFGKSNVMISGGRNFFAGYSEVDTARNKQWKPKEQYFTDWQFNHFFDKHTFRYSGNFYQDHILNRGAPRLPYRETAFDDHFKTLRLTNSLFFRGEVAKNRFIDITGSYSYYERKKNTYFKDLVTLEEIFTSDPADQDTNSFDSWVLRSTYSHDNVISWVSYQTGFDLNMSTASGRRINENEKTLEDYAAFVSIQFRPIDEITIQPAMRVIHNSNYDAPLVPSINLKTDVTGFMTIRASYARGFRAPSIQELHFMFVDINHNIRGNEGLKAETSHSYNFLLNFHTQTNNYAFKFEPGIYYNDIKDLITLGNIENDLWSYVNIGKFQTIGANMTLSYIRTDLNSKIGVSYIGRSHQFSETIAASPLVFSPEVMANVIYNSQFFGITASVFYKYTGGQSGFNVDESGTEYSSYEIEDYHTLDLTFSKDIFDKSVNLTVGAKNLFDVKDIKRSRAGSGGVHSGSETSSPVAWGRTFFTSIRFNF